MMTDRSNNYPFKIYIKKTWNNKINPKQCPESKILTLAFWKNLCFKSSDDVGLKSKHY